MEDIRYKLYTNKFDALLEVCRVAAEIYEADKKQDKSWGKRFASSHDQESDKEAVFCSRTCSMSREELFRWGRKKSVGETSLSSRYYGFLDDQVVEDKVLGKKSMYYGPRDFEYYDRKERFLGKKRNFEYYDREEKALGKKRNYLGSKDEDYEYSEKKEKKRRTNVNVNVMNRVVETAPLPVEFAHEIQRLGGNDVILLIQKTLTATDLSRKQNRLNMPYNQLQEEAKDVDFLTEDEKKRLEQRDAKDHIVPIQVPILEPNLNRSYIKLKKWPVNTSFWYALCGSWGLVQEINHLQVETEFQVWSFRVNGELNLALVKVTRDVIQI